MATIVKIAITIDTLTTIALNEDELMAINALAIYGVDSFLKNFYLTMGRNYLYPHEVGLRSFFKAVHNCSHHTKAANECREFLAAYEKKEEAV